MTEVIDVGKSYSAAYPFIREVYSYWVDSGDTGLIADGKNVNELCWKPGVKYEMIGPYAEDGTAVANGMGSVTYHVVSICPLPRPYPARVFYTRQWTSPDGRVFGKKKLRVITLVSFRNLIKGFRYHVEVVIDLSEDEKKALAA